MAIQKISFMHRSRWGEGSDPPPLKIHKLYGFLLKIAFGSPALEKVGPPGKWWTPPGLMMELPLKPG